MRGIEQPRAVPVGQPRNRPSALECPLPFGMSPAAAGQAHWELSCLALCHPDSWFGAGVSGEGTAVFPVVLGTMGVGRGGVAILSRLSGGTEAGWEQLAANGTGWAKHAHFPGINCAKGCLWPSGAVAHWCSLLGWMCCTAFQRSLERKLCNAHPHDNDVPLNGASLTRNLLAPARSTLWQSQ